MQNDLISRSYVDAELQKAQKSLEANSDYVWARNQGHHKGLAWARRIVQDTPGAESETVVHGRWLTSSDVPDTLICSACGRRYDMYFFDQKNMPYCLCGCKMDEDTDVDVCERSVDTVSVVRCKDCVKRGSPYSCPMRKLVMPHQGPGAYEDCTVDNGYCHEGERKSSNKDSKKCCLACVNSLSADAMDGSQVLVCFECAGHEHQEMQVDEEDCCDNFKEE